MSLQDKLDAYKADFRKKAPKDAQAIMHRATEDLQNSGLVESAVGVGDRAPGFSLTDTDGSLIGLPDLIADGPVLLGFYRGRW